MSKFHRLQLVVIFAACTVILFSVARNFGVLTQTAVAQEETSETTSSTTLEHRGKYLVHHVAKCIECHTPRDARGELLETRLLRGAPIPVRGPKYAKQWAAQSVSLAGLGNYEETFIHYLLTHGTRPDGSAPDSPMPSFHLHDEDASAVIAYLKTISPG